ncbi:MAG: energy-coupling factor ABC transporter ATP-binding protein [Thermomicrobiales bacterium]|nr:energy-coupling factor ABC transporter ATP-binding protein [Thermomicrobiales bacterium]
MSDARIKVEHVSFAYSVAGQPDHLALNDVSLRIDPGKLVAIAGRNGSGKSTLARHLNGLLKPDAGSVTVDGTDTRTESVGRLAARIGYVFQNPDHQLFLPSVRKEVEWGPSRLGLTGAALNDRVDDTLTRFGLADVAGRHPASLGRGLRRLTALAAVMAMDPGAIVLDEPTGGLDLRLTTALMTMLQSLTAEGRSVILITHEMRLVAEYAQRLVVLSQGRIVADGPPSSLFADQDLMTAASLAAPEAARIAQSLEPYGVPRGVTTSDGVVAAVADLLARER